MNNFDKLNPLPDSNSEAILEEKRKKLISVLKPIIDKKLSLNPDYLLTLDELRSIRKKYPELFLDFPSVRSITDVFGGQMSAIRLALGQPEGLVRKPKKEEEPVREQWFIERRELILKLLEPWVQKKKKENIVFKITRENLEEFMKEHPDVFRPPLTHGLVTAYFDNGTSRLNEKFRLV